MVSYLVQREYCLVIRTHGDSFTPSTRLRRTLQRPNSIDMSPLRGQRRSAILSQLLKWLGTSRSCRSASRMTGLGTSGTCRSTSRLTGPGLLALPHRYQGFHTSTAFPNKYQRFQTSIIPSRTVRQTFSTLGSCCTFSSNATMARLSSS